MAEDKLKACSMCFSDTKYPCIKCERPVCNVCGVPELDEDTDGWIYVKQVSYCYSILTKRKLIMNEGNRNLHIICWPQNIE